MPSNRMVKIVKDLDKETIKKGGTIGLVTDTGEIIILEISKPYKEGEKIVFPDSGEIINPENK